MRCWQSATALPCCGMAAWSIECTPEGVTKSDLAQMMVGRPIILEYDRAEQEQGKPMLGNPGRMRAERPRHTGFE